MMALVCGRLFERLAMPQAVGEIVGGMILGPTILGHFFPDVYSWMFNAFPAQAALLSAFNWIGLILLMFVAGFRVQRELTRDDRFIVGLMLVSSVLFPMAGSYFIGHLL